MNKVILIGRLTKDPELTYIPGSGTAVTRVTLAIDDYYSKTNKKQTQFIPVVVWGKQGENLAQYMSKGSLISVSGKVRNYSYTDKTGIKRYGYEIVADMLNGVRYLSKTNSQDNYKNLSNDGYSKNNYNRSSYDNRNPNNKNYDNSFSNKGSNSNPYGNSFGGYPEDLTPVDDEDMPF